MCVNYRPANREVIRTHFGLEPPAFDYAAEVFAGQFAPVLMAAPSPSGHGGALIWQSALFGLVPHWAKDTTIARQTYNARSETVAEKPSFRTPWRRRQFCLVPMECFFEPSYESGRAVRWSIGRRDAQPFAPGAIWDAWRSPSGEVLYSFSMLTLNADAHPLMARFHKPDDEKRSLVIVPPESWADWLNSDESTARGLLTGPAPGVFVGEATPIPTPMARTTSPDLFSGLRLGE